MGIFCCFGEKSSEVKQTVQYDEKQKSVPGSSRTSEKRNSHAQASDLPDKKSIIKSLENDKIDNEDELVNSREVFASTSQTQVNSVTREKGIPQTAVEAAQLVSSHPVEEYTDVDADGNQTAESKIAKWMQGFTLEDLAPLGLTDPPETIVNIEDVVADGELYENNEPPSDLDKLPPALRQRHEKAI